MKKVARLTATLLAMVMLISPVVQTAHAVSLDTFDVYQYGQFVDETIGELLNAVPILPEDMPESAVVQPVFSFTRVAPFKAPAVGMASMETSTRALTLDTAARSDNGLSLSKTVRENEDGSYTLRLESYATGAKVITNTSEDVPTDIVLVLDQSGSMSQSFGTLDTAAYLPYTNTNSNFYDNEDETIYYQREDGSYVTVNVIRQSTVSYTVANNTNYQFYSGRDYPGYYYLNDNGEYQKVSITRSGDYPNRIYTYSVNNTTIGISNGDNTNPEITLYRASNNNNYSYTYSYTLDGVTTTIETSSGQNSSPSGPYYTYVEAGRNITRLQALKIAVSQFTNSVATKAKGSDGTLGTADDVDHQIAVVGFASKYNTEGYGNTELLSITGSNSGSVGKGYYSNSGDDTNLTNTDYQNVLQDMSTSAGVSMVSNAVNALAASGATQVDLGLEMAAKVFANNPINPEKKRNRIVIVFCDGHPSSFSNYSLSVANDAVSSADSIRSNYSATVYSIGVFPGADATSAGSKPEGDLSYNANNITNEFKAACNWFMQRISDNKGTPQNPSYYLSASNTSALNSIFQQISDQVETGGSSSTLTAEAVMMDYVTESFTVPENASNLKIYTADYTGANQWGTEVPVATDSGITGTFTEATDENGKKVEYLEVTGFDYSTNWCGTETTDGQAEYRGKKLIVEFDVIVREGFLGGNGVTTNATGSGVYENSNAETPVEEFTSPAVNIPIAAVVTVAVPDTNVYLLDNVASSELEAILQIKVGDVPLDMDAENYGLEDWQHAYVEIDDNAALNNFNNLLADQEYSVTVTVEPNEEADRNLPGSPALSQSGTANGKINVFKPVLTFEDSVENYLADVFKDSITNVTGYHDAENYVSEAWVHTAEDGTKTTVTVTTGEDGTTTTTPTMVGTKPTLTIAYDTKEADITAEGIVEATEDIPVNVTVKIGDTPIDDYVTFEHVACTDLPDGVTCGYDASECEFIVHVTNVVGDLKIIKEAAEGTSFEEGETFIFTISGGNLTSAIQVVIKGEGSITIQDLPVAEYTITEDTGWSWRYTVVGDASVTKTIVGGGEVEAVFTNKLNNTSWIDGSTYAENNFTDSGVERVN